MSNLDCHYSAPRKRGPKASTVGAQSSPDRIDSPPTTTQNSTAQIDTQSMNSPSSSDYALRSPSLLRVSVADTFQGSRSRTMLAANLDHELVGIVGESLDALKAEIQQAVNQTSSESLSGLVDNCINSYIGCLFPIAPIIHEVSLRKLAMSLSDCEGTALGHQSSLDACRSFALITAVCAEVGYMLPSHMSPLDANLAATFFHVSKRALLLCRDADMKSLNSSSVIVRYLHSNCTHAIGHVQQAWIIMGEAIRLALQMKLHDEKTYVKLSSIERQLCRNIFWQLYTADRSSSMLNLNSFMLHDLLLCDSLTVDPPEPKESSLLASGDSTREQIILRGFNACQDIFHFASELCLEMKLATRYSTTSGATNVHEVSMAALYFRFNTALDKIPLELQIPQVSSSAASPSMYQIQAANLLVTKHCLRLLILQRCAQYGLHHVLGLPVDKSLLGLRVLEIARDFTMTLQAIPFEALRVNGEPSNEKIRQVGACLLEMQYESQETLLSSRAAQDLEILLDVLSRLDSRASQTLLASRGAT